MLALERIRPPAKTRAAGEGYAEMPAPPVGAASQEEAAGIVIISGKKHLAGGQQFLDAPIPSKVRLAGEQHASLGLDDQWMIDYNSIIKLDRAFLFKGAIRC